VVVYPHLRVVPEDCQTVGSRDAAGVLASLEGRPWAEGADPLVLLVTPGTSACVEVTGGPAAGGNDVVDEVAVITSSVPGGLAARKMFRRGRHFELHCAKKGAYEVKVENVMGGKVATVGRPF
jgi:hypothetical protein